MRAVLKNMDIIVSEAVSEDKEDVGFRAVGEFVVRVVKANGAEIVIDEAESWGHTPAQAVTLFQMKAEQKATEEVITDE